MKTSSLLMVAMIAFCVWSLFFTINEQFFFAIASMIVSTVLYIASTASQKEGD
jgi:hypothetical protein